MAKHESAQVDQHVGQRLRMRRLALEKSQEWLARSVGLTFQQVQKYEKGTNRVSASRLQQFANLLNVPVSYFFEDNPSDQKTGKLDPDMARPGRWRTDRPRQRKRGKTLPPWLWGAKVVLRVERPAPRNLRRLSGASRQRRLQSLAGRTVR
jgi:transcriptional regulator with XRE-family HTH domain